VIALALLLVAQSNPFDQFDTKAPAFSGPAKMIIFSATGATTVIDYPTQARCDAARLVLQRLMVRENDSHPPQTLPNGGTITTLPLSARMLCFPG